MIIQISFSCNTTHSMLIETVTSTKEIKLAFLKGFQLVRDKFIDEFFNYLSSEHKGEIKSLQDWDDIDIDNIAHKRFCSYLLYKYQSNDSSKWEYDFEKAAEYFSYWTLKEELPYLYIKIAQEIDISFVYTEIKFQEIDINHPMTGYACCAE